MKKLLIAGTDSIHTLNFLKLIRKGFTSVAMISNNEIDERGIDAQEIINPSLRNPLMIAGKVSRIREFIKKFNPDIIHIQQAGTLAFLVLFANKGLGIPAVVTAWGSDVLINPDRSFRHRAMLKYILKNADALTADADVVAEKIKKLCKDVPEVIISSFGVDMPEKPSEKENVIYSNRLHKKLYRIDRIVSAFAEFSVKNGGVWKLIIAGAGEESGNLQGLAAEKGLSDKIEFAGWVDREKNMEYYSKARIFVSIPESDATSVSLLEAMAHGCLPVVSDLEANRQWITHESNGLIVDDVNSDFLSPAINMDFEMAQNINRELVREKASYDAALKNFENLYGTLLKKADE